MPINKESYLSIRGKLGSQGVCLVAVSKTKPLEDLLELYNMGQRDFGENYVQELIEKQPLMPQDTKWHFIGHLQSNKVKYIAPFVHLIHSVDSLKLLTEIDKQGAKLNRTINCLLQVHIAQEETKFGFGIDEIKPVIENLCTNPLSNAKVIGLMGMASLTDDSTKTAQEFKQLAELYGQLKNSETLKCANIDTLSMGMSNDYQIAIREGSNMVRIGSLIFGSRI